jgi:succinate dehydrogenase / fumarate reductase flavoprotein subunit
MPGVKAKTCETSIPGLYSAMHTLSEMGSVLAWTQGCMSGKNAAIQATGMKEIPVFSDKNVQKILNKAYGLLEATPSHPLRATEIHRRIQRAFYKGLHVIRDERGMQTALDELVRIQKEDLPRLNVPVKSRQFNRDWRNAMEVESMLLCSIGTAYASLYRKETRPFHYRTDYPVMDNDNWMVNVWVTMQKDGTWSVHKTPVVDSVYSVAEMKKMLVPVDLREPNEL